MIRRVDILGQRFGRLVVIAPAAHVGRAAARWQCRCDCGAVKITRGSDLRAGRVQSCGCSRRSEQGPRPAPKPRIRLVRPRPDAERERRVAMLREARARWLEQHRGCVYTVVRSGSTLHATADLCDALRRAKDHPGSSVVRSDGVLLATMVAA